MSVRAHRINKIDFEQAETFNLYHDEELNSFFEDEWSFYESLPEGVGITELPVKALEDAVLKIKDGELIKEREDLKGAELENYKKEMIEQLQTDIDWAKANDHEYINYYCF